MASLYRGFNTIGRDFGPYHLSDNALVIRDFLNNLYIRKGEKLNHPAFGSMIWSSMFEPLTPALKEAIRLDVTKIVGYDPRIRNLNAVTVTEYENGIRVDVNLTFSSNNEVANLALQFDKNNFSIYLA